MVKALAGQIEGASAPNGFDGSAKSLFAALKGAGLPEDVVVYLTSQWLAFSQQPSRWSFPRGSGGYQDDTRAESRRRWEDLFGKELTDRYFDRNLWTDMKLRYGEVEPIRGLSREDVSAAKEIEARRDNANGELQKKFRGQGDSWWNDPEYLRLSQEISDRFTREMKERLGEDGYDDFKLGSWNSAHLEVAEMAGIGREEMRGWLRLQERFAPLYSEQQGIQDAAGRDRRRRELVRLQDQEAAVLFGESRYRQFKKYQTTWYWDLKRQAEQGKSSVDPDRVYEEARSWQERLDGIDDAGERAKLLIEGKRSLARSLGDLSRLADGMLR